VATSQTLTIALLGSDVVAMAQCMVIDADAFPYPSIRIGERALGTRVWFARDESRDETRPAVGFLAAHPRRGALYVDGLAVDGAARRRGVGSALLRAAADAARAEGLRAMDLCVGVANGAAVALYERAGFARVRRISGYYAPGVYGRERDAYEMTLRLHG
jgi:ribosomal protein S18 acetylase RimI-like enzyme